MNNTTNSGNGQRMTITPAHEINEPVFSQVPEHFLIYGKHLSPRAKWVYAVLRKFWNKKDKRCFPTRQTIAKFAGMSVKTIDKALHELQTFGWIKRYPIPSKYEANGQPMMQNDMTYPITQANGNQYFRESPTKAEATTFHRKTKPSAFIAGKLPEPEFVVLPYEPEYVYLPSDSEISLTDVRLDEQGEPLF